MLTILDLFSGIGGFSYAAEVLVGGYKTIGFCEYDKKCQEVLKLRFPSVPIYPDIRELNEPIHADIITGGYPCQPFSQAGKRGGENDDRHLWPEMFRVIQLVKPTYVICENVAGHISMGLDSVLSDLESEGYRTEVFVLGAVSVDAPHKRSRVWIMAYSSSDTGGQSERGVDAKAIRVQEKNRQTRCGGGESCRASGVEQREAFRVHEEGDVADTNNAGSGQRLRVDGNGQEKDQGRKGQSFTEFSKASEDVADTSKQGLEGCSQAGNTGSKGQESGNEYSGGCDRGRGSKWPVEPSVGRVAHGISGRVDRLKQLGNSIVPQIAAQLFRAIKEIENELT